MVVSYMLKSRWTGASLGPARCAVIPIAAHSPAARSDSGNAIFVGPDSGSPLTLMSPVRAWTIRSNAGRCDHVPSAPKPLIEHKMIVGFALHIQSNPYPIVSRRPARRFSITTSDCSTSRESTSPTSRCLRSSVMLFLARFTAMK